MHPPAAEPARGFSLTGPIRLKSNSEIDAIARAGLAAERALADAVACCVAGATTEEVASAAAERLAREGADALFLGHRQGDAPPFPAAACVSVNEQVVHGVPSARALREHDLVSIDIGARVGGWCADVATTVHVPGRDQSVARERLDLIDAVHRSLGLALELATPGLRWSVIGAAMESLAREAGLGIVTEFVGHGVGRELHEPPRVPAYVSAYSGDDFELTPGMVIAVEPILCLPAPGRRYSRGEGRPVRRVPIVTSADGWTVSTADGSLAAHAEITLAVEAAGVRILAAPARPVGPERAVRL